MTKPLPNQSFANEPAFAALVEAKATSTYLNLPRRPLFVARLEVHENRRRKELLLAKFLRLDNAAKGR
jgi:hypothetical protein